MKKVFTILIIFIIFICLYLLQTKIFNKFTIAGIKPNLFIIFALMLGLFMKKFYTPIICTIMGLLIDFFSSDIIGINAIMLLIASAGGILFTKNFSKDSKITIMLMASLMTLICEIISYCLRIIILQTEINFFIFLKIISLEILYNIILIIILYPIIQKFGDKIEKIFTKDKVLTRYF